MAQINITLNQEEILQLLSNDRDEAFKQLLQESLNCLIKAESSEQLKANPYERSDERTDSRNGTRQRDLKTRIGTITLSVPRHRNQPFKSMIFDTYSRSEAALVAAMAEMVVNGVSTRKVSQVVETLCGTSFSKSTVSDVCKDLDEVVEEFKNRPLTDDYPFMTVDATYFKVRENHRIISKAFMIAYGTNDRGIREIIGFGVYHNESKETWTSFFKSLKARGLKGLKMITSDAHEGILHAISHTYPDVPWQRCQFHFSKNITESVPKKYQTGLRSELQDMFNSETIEQAYKKRDAILTDYREVSEKAMECLENGFESAMTVMLLPKNIRKSFRTSNYVERLNRELKRRSKVVSIFPNERSLLRLMGSVLVEHNDALLSKTPLFYKPAYREVLDMTSKLRALAVEQQKLLVA